MPQVIFNADDFGFSPSVNAAVIRAHRDGVLTSASLMVTGAAFGEAVALAKENPRLAVGLHLVLVQGRSALPPSELPHLVDADGRFRDDPGRAGLAYFFSRAARAELAREIDAQLRLFAGTGLALNHVDGHLHLHVHPAVIGILAPLAKRYGARGIRLPNDDLLLALRHDRRHAVSKAANGLAFALLSRWGARKLRRAGLARAARVYGLHQSGHMERGYVLGVLQGLREPTAELYLHPNDGPRLDELGPNAGDLETLLCPEVRQLVASRSLQLATYASLGGGG